MSPNKPVLLDGQIVLPYNTEHPIKLYRSNVDGNNDIFIRAKHDAINRIWWSEVDPEAENGNTRINAPGMDGNSGLIVFVEDYPRVLCSHGIRVTRIFNAGNSAKGVVFRLPPNVVLKQTLDQQSVLGDKL